MVSALSAQKHPPAACVTGGSLLHPTVGPQFLTMFCPPSHHVSQGEAGDKHQKVTKQESGSGFKGRAPPFKFQIPGRGSGLASLQSGIWKHLWVSCGQRMDTIEMLTHVCVYDTHPALTLQVLAANDWHPSREKQEAVLRTGTNKCIFFVSQSLPIGLSFISTVILALDVQDLMTEKVWISQKYL